MTFLEVGGLYTRKDVWKILDGEGTFPLGGPWLTGYLIHGKYLIAFANIDAGGRTGHEFPNTFDESSGKMEWFGKPNAHSEQPTFRKLFQGMLKLLMFVRWDNKNGHFTYLGSPNIESFENDTVIDGTTRTLKIFLKFDWEEEIADFESSDYQSYEGLIKQTLLSKYERDPKLRAACVRLHGCKCSICGFDFQAIYGEIGKNYCHIHHITPLSEQGEERKISAKDDLIPVCANCHAMLHRSRPALHPIELKKMLRL